MSSFKYILLVIKKDDDMKEVLENLLGTLEKEEFSGEDDWEFILDFENNVEKAEKRLAADPVHYNLLIVELHIFADSKSTSYENKKLGLKFLQDLRSKNVPVSSILICPTLDQEVVDFQGSCTGDMSCELLSQTEDWGENLKKKVKKSLTCPLEEEQRKLGKVDILLDFEENKNEYRMSGEGFSFNVARGALKGIDPFIKQDLIRRSKKLTRQNDWSEELHTIGGYLLRSLFDNNPDFHCDFKEIVHKAGGEENIRIRYIVEENIHPIALEALLDRDDEYRMLHFPIFRTVNTKGINPPLFKDEETRTKPINCLIIDANSSGEVELSTDTPKIQLAPLTKAKDETVKLEKLLNELKKEGEAFPIAVGKVTRLFPKEGEKSFCKRVENALENGTWHIVHFAGHSHYDEKDQKGYVFFPGKRGQPVFSEIEEFAQWLRKADVRFVYLSSCSSADVDFVFQLAQQYIPAIMGFRWPIDDEKAMEHALVFYDKLLKGSKRLEYAFLETRKDLALKKKYKNKNYIWAASILTMQTDV